MDKKFIFNSKSLFVYLGHEIQMDFTIFSVSTSMSPRSNTLLFITNLTQEIIAKISKIEKCIIILSNEYRSFTSLQNLILYVDRPRKEYAKLLQYILEHQPLINRKYITSNGNFVLGENTTIGENTFIEPFCFIDHDVSIGNNCHIKSGARIRSNCIIGDNCIIKENSVIGSSGFGVERDETGITYKIPHIGGVVIHDNVEVGALCSIASGTIDPTVINSYVKIDDCVFIAHNCKIGKGTLLTANSEISGSVIIGENVWIGPNTSVKEKIRIGDRVLVGIGAVVTNDVDNDMTIAGNPAIPIQDLKKIRFFYKKILDDK